MAVTENTLNTEIATAVITAVALAAMSIAVATEAAIMCCMATLVTDGDCRQQLLTLAAASKLMVLERRKGRKDKKDEKEE